MIAQIKDKNGSPAILGHTCTFDTPVIRQEILSIFETNKNFNLPARYTYETKPSGLYGTVAKICVSKNAPKPDHSGIMLHDHINQIIEGANGSISDFDPYLISDGFHTFGELYKFRKMYNALLFNQWSNLGKYGVHKSRRHNDGALPFGREDFFIVAAELPGAGQISNHYNIKDWYLFQIPIEERCLFEYDGHTSQDCLDRMNSLISEK